MKAISDRQKGKRWILLGAFITYIPLVYWRFTEGETSLFAKGSFFPHYLIMILLAVGTVFLQKWIARKFSEPQSYYLLVHVSGAVILVTYVLCVTVGMFFLNRESTDEIGVWIFSFAVLGTVVLLYEIMMFVISMITGKIVEKVKNKQK